MSEESTGPPTIAAVGSCRGVPTWGLPLSSPSPGASLEELLGDHVEHLLDRNPPAAWRVHALEPTELDVALRYACPRRLVHVVAHGYLSALVVVAVCEEFVIGLRPLLVNGQERPIPKDYPARRCSFVDDARALRLDDEPVVVLVQVLYLWRFVFEFRPYMLARESSPDARDPEMVDPISLMRSGGYSGCVVRPFDGSSV